MLGWAMTNAGGPREPWHDLHCKIEGHAAYDILTHVEQHWRKATLVGHHRSNSVQKDSMDFESIS